MKTNLLALLVGAAMLSSVGIAVAETKEAENKEPAGTQPIILTDIQMSEVTAGHLYDHPGHNLEHKGDYWFKTGSTLGIWDHFEIRNDVHTGCGARPCQ